MVVEGSQKESLDLGFVLLNTRQQSIPLVFITNRSESEYYACTTPVTIDGEDLEDVKTFTYLGSIIDEHVGSDVDVKARIGKARAAYLQMKDIWNSKQFSTNTKVRIFNSNFKTVLLYGAET
ncbi:unnamed protein product [Schistosoma margrebowiei]|uniref:Uncharacterized protein n=1 Tax=Schistosoma margrebowiei TaxID=48269 RepID=A0A183LI60_9TREM|nr:unnamed protein product [Schistosoma margrebowiei]